MKKALSVLLVAAAIFGFYGSAVSVNDILACKDYWEEAGEKSTADMNKLEDGLNQLKENEQAYLDGQDQLAEGEKALADGEAQYEQGLKDYAEAPGKLAAGEKKLAEGEKSYKDLKTLIKGLREARKHGVKTTKAHDTYWHDGYTFDTYKKNGKAGLKPGRNYIVQTLNSEQMAQKVAIIEMLAGQEVASLFNVKSYKEFDGACLKAKGILEQVGSTLSDFLSDAETARQAGAAYYTAVMTGKEPSPDDMVSAAKALNDEKYKEIRGLIKQLGGTDLVSAIEGIAAYEEAVVSPEAAAGFMVGFAKDSKDAGYDEKKSTVVPTMKSYSGTLDEVIDTLGAWDDGYNTLLDGKDQLASTSEGIPYAFKNMVTNPTIKKAIKKYDPKLMSILKKYKGSRLNNDEFGDEFDKDLTYLAKKVIPRCLNVLKHVKSSAEGQLADGRKQLAQGRADYAAAPGKLAEAEQMLADGRQQLEDGKAQLAQYEDGEQQVRDGLAQLVGTEPDLELESIADRLNGDTDFDNGDEHLDIDEGLSAVDVGRGYQADDGVLITNEIMARAVGTAGLLAAGVLAVIAAILSFLKKNKGAGVFALLAAAAGAFGAVYGTQAGTYFSSIAGSTVGATGWIAAGILGGVALVHAIVHFAAPKSV